MSEDVQDLLDGLIQQLCPDWSCEFPGPLAPDHERFELIAAKRMQVARVLRRRPDRAAALSEQVLATIVADEDSSCNRQLVAPLVTAIGRSAVLAGLLSYARSGSPAQQAGAARGWYWAQPTLVYPTRADLDNRRPTAASQAEWDEMADLCRAFRIACLTAFLATDDVRARADLAMRFTLNPEDYPPELAAEVDEARSIAAGDPQRYRRLLTDTTEAGLSQLGARPLRPVLPDP
ncbi:hypothetical protein [Micromonospora sp. NPDC049274]|uniref:hypothetical protein n=1 Tax=Micromonospora sp. NPDC049274 TaxID=3154829 RepID=UPI00342B1C94